MAMFEGFHIATAAHLHLACHGGSGFEPQAFDVLQLDYFFLGVVNEKFTVPLPPLTVTEPLLVLSRSCQASTV